MRRKSLLEKAKSEKVKKRPHIEITDEHVELALAWARDEIGMRQAARAIGAGGNIYSFLAHALARYVRDGAKRK